MGVRLHTAVHDATSVGLWLKISTVTVWNGGGQAGGQPLLPHIGKCAPPQRLIRGPSSEGLCSIKVHMLAVMLPLLP